MAAKSLACITNPIELTFVDRQWTTVPVNAVATENQCFSYTATGSDTTVFK